MPSFNVSCPSCEASVPVRNPNQIGTKIECPKCKYRFKVDAPPDAEEEGGGPAAKEKDAPKEKGKKGKGKKGGGEKADKKPANKKMLIGVGVGVVAVVLLVVAGMSVLGDKKGVAKGTGKGTPPVANSGDNKADGNTGGDKTDDGKDKDGKDKDGKDDKKPAPPPVPTSDKDPTNLLPGDTREVFRVNADRLRQSPFVRSLFDANVEELFQTSMGFPLGSVQSYIHCTVDPDGAAFGVLRLSGQVEEGDLTGRIDVAPGPRGPILGRKYHVFKSNPFAAAVARTFSTTAWVGAVAPPPAAKPKPKADVPLALCVYDPYTLLLGDQPVVEKFLTELQPSGYPRFKSEFTPPKAVGPKPKTPADGGPKKDAADPKADPKDGKDAGKEPAEKRMYTAIPTYRTIDPKLKEALNNLEPEERANPIVLYAGRFDPKDIPAVTADTPAPVGTALKVLSGVDAVGLNLSAFTDKNLSALLMVSMKTDDEARRVAKDLLIPALTVGAPGLSVAVNSPVLFRNLNSPTPGVPDPGTPGTVGLPGGEGPTPMPTPMPTPGPGDPNTPNTPPTGPVDPVTGLPRPASVTVFDVLSRKSVTGPPSYLDLLVSGRVMTLAVDYNPPDEAYRTLLAPNLQVGVNQVRGRMLVMSGVGGWHALGAATPKLAARTVSSAPPFPRGAYPRPTDLARYGLPHPASGRVSLFADVLPFLGKDKQALAGAINREAAWFDATRAVPTQPSNADLAEEWVPELLVPYYPARGWQAASPHAEGRALGATNFVAVAGLGADAARYDPANPAHAKKVGMTGYEWGSKPDDVKDGLANTVYLIQVPPTAQRPWMAGGGATVTGVDDRLPNPIAGFATTRPDGKSGAYAVMGDGSVRWIPAGIDPKVFKALVTRAGGETLEDFEAAAPKVPKRGEAELKAKPPAPKETAKADPPAPPPAAPPGEPAPAPRPKDVSATEPK